ncbi:hypothetical protein MH215_20275 [Paenibacillus sp. ACRSA]|uniref:hypothetical protein n=1 Tax=Paenibacillus sp. ACRSA TaxID=2918211 RepID=UPI001EF579AE|nr:hypothetical protein [Paenibacillus sp. ACRSA]MCG7379341.1 hypothetical protein [Paenibacillus sp. ACRSA]
MAFTKEYAANVTVNKKEVLDMMKAQRAMYDKGIIKQDRAGLVADLAGVVGVLSIFLQSTPGGIAGAVTQALLASVPSEKAALDAMVKEGHFQMGYLADWFDANPNFDIIEVKLPFIEYETQRIRFVTGRGAIQRVHKKGGPWMNY